MTETKRGRGRPKGTTRATAKKIADGLEAITAFIESEDYADATNYETRRRVEGAQKTLTRALSDFQGAS